MAQCLRRASQGRKMSGVEYAVPVTLTPHEVEGA